MIKKLVENQGQDGTYCEKVLGSTPNVDIVAGFFGNNPDLLRLIATNAMLEYLEGDISKEEFTAYKNGVFEVGAFMDRCLRERQERSQKKEPKDDY